jgi:hypothetical protein
MGTVNRDSKKIVLDNVHTSSVSKAVWPIHTRMNTYIMYNKNMQLKRRHKLPHAETAIPSSLQGNAHKTTPYPAGLAPALRIVSSLCVTGLALVLSIFYSWTMLLILSLICATITLIMMHLLVNEETLTRKNWVIRRTKARPNPSEERLPQQQNAHHAQHTMLTGAIKHRRLPSALPVSAATSPIAEDGQTSQHQQPDSAIPFPTTPMPATPVIRVLDTIDLSSTNIEHFLDL